MESIGKITICEYAPHNEKDVLYLLDLNTPQYFAASEKEDFRFYLRHEIEKYYIASMNNIIVGCGGINIDNNTGKISWDIIHPKYQGKGIGTVLLKYRIDKLKLYPQIRSIVVRTSQYVYKFYEKNGFKLKETQKDYWAKGFDLYKMEFGTLNKTI